MEETIFKPKKRIFMALTSISAIIGALMIYVVWKVTVPGLAQIHYLLPKLMGVVGAVIAFALMIGVIGIVLALLGISMFKVLFFWAWKAINILFPFAVVLGRLFNIPRSKIEQSFIEVSNNLVMQHKIKVPAERILILTPHCIQRDTCVHKITRNVAVAVWAICLLWHISMVASWQLPQVVPLLAKWLCRQDPRLLLPLPASEI